MKAAFKPVQIIIYVVIIHAVFPLPRHRDAHLAALAHKFCADAPN
jgi:hypothetical protein